jgi:Zn ribbon nucleic-acid-binding protein
VTPDAHCPECGGKDRPIVHVRPSGDVKRRCVSCGHTAWTQGEPEVAGERPLAELLLRQDRTTVRVATERGELP